MLGSTPIFDAFSFTSATLWRIGAALPWSLKAFVNDYLRREVALKIVDATRSSMPTLPLGPLRLSLRLRLPRFASITARPTFDSFSSFFSSSSRLALSLSCRPVE
ncbi:hypothetical protein EV122DRAFT_277552 [Schizophyllum commune]